MQVQINLAAGDAANAGRLASELYARLEKTAPDQRNSPQLLNELKAKTLTARASTYLQARPPNTSAARADFTAARDLSPNAPSSHSNLAAVALAERKADEAIEHYERALSLDAASFDALNGLVTLYMSQGKFDQAQARVDQAMPQTERRRSISEGGIYGVRGIAEARETRADGSNAQNEGPCRRARTLEMDRRRPSQTRSRDLHQKERLTAIADFAA